jgi:hypothetical protein
MIKYGSLQKKLAIAATVGISMLLLAASCFAQTSLETNGSDNCTCLGHQLSPETNFEACTYSSVPDKATLVSPNDVIGIANPTFVWNPADGCTEYCLKVADASQPNVPIKEICYDAHEVLSDWGCSVTPELNLLPGSYRWWINTSNCKGEGGWSNYMEFTYQAGLEPGISTPISPMGLISTKTPTFKWTAVPATTRYHIQVDRDPFGTVDANMWFDSEKVTHGGLCSALSTVILPDQVYTWRIQACIDGKCGDQSEWEYFENVCAFKPGAAKNKARMFNR